MRKIFIAFVMLFVVFIVKSQTIVVTTPQLKNVVIEEYTGIHCGYCPDGHARAEALSAANPDRIVLINIHQGNFSTPGTGEPDFRTVFGDSLAIQAAVAGYPNATVNRHKFSDLGANTALGRNLWATAASKILPEASPVNVGFTSSFDSISRVLTITVELYYVQSSPQSTNFINVAFLESHVIGYQSDYANGTHQDYDHKHILRHLITGQWGDKVTTTTKGTVVNRVYNYTVPAGFVVKNSDLAVFVTETHQEVYTGVQGKADGGSHNGATQLYIGALKPPTVPVSKGVSAQKVSYTFQAESALSGAEDFKITLEKDCEADWTATFNIDGTPYTQDAIVNLTQGVAKNILIEVIPGSTADFAEFRLKMESVNNPSSMNKVQKVYVISGVNDLVINNSSAWGNGGDTLAVVFESNFLNGLTFAGNNAHASIGSDVILLTKGTNVLDDVKNLYYNVGWSFPSLSDDLADVFSAFLDKGGNMMVSGQDIAWDNFDDKGYGTQKTMDFCTNYLHAGYMSDGVTSNNQLTVKATDAVYGLIGNSSIVNVYGTDGSGTPYFYPDELVVAANGQAVFNYNSGSKIAAVRSRMDTYKTFFIGVSLEMISDEAIRKEIMKITYDWFSGILSADDFDKSITKVLTFPNPASDFTTIMLPNDQSGTLKLIDMKGSVVGEWKFDKNENQLRITTSTFNQGLYNWQIHTEAGVKSGLLEIAR